MKDRKNRKRSLTDSNAEVTSRCDRSGVGSNWKENQVGGRIWLIAVLHGFAFVSRVLLMLDREPILLFASESLLYQNFNDVLFRVYEEMYVASCDRFYDSSISN